VIHSTAPRPEIVGRSPFTGWLVHILAGLKIASTARQPVFDEDVWDLTGLLDVSIQIPPNVLTWDFTKIEDDGWRLVAREFLVAVLVPRHERVLTLPLARRDALGLATCHDRLATVITWFRWLTGQGVQSLEQVTQDHCDRYLHQRQADGVHNPAVMGEVSAIKDLARYGELFTADRYRPGFVPWDGTSAKAVSSFSTNGENKTPPVADRVLRPALLAGLFLVEVLGPHVAELMDHIRVRRATRPDASRPRRDAFGELAQSYVAQGQPLPEVDGHVVRDRLKGGIGRIHCCESVSASWAVTWAHSSSGHRRFVRFGISPKPQSRRSESRPSGRVALPSSTAVTALALRRGPRR
jgi:hypothetical protein